MEYKTIFLIALTVFFIGAIMTTVPVSAITQSNTGTYTGKQTSQQSNSGAGGVNHCTQKRTVNGVTTITSC